jgi:putative tricarboxylic transport membrane protein
LRTDRISADTIVGIGIALLGVAFAIGTLRIEVQTVYAKVGPTFVPWLVSGGLTATGILLAWTSLRDPQAASHAVKPEWRPVAWIFLGLIADWLLFKPAGFIVASTVLFFCVARGFGSRSAVWDTIIGALTAIAAYVLFRYALNLNLPGFLAGVWR